MSTRYARWLWAAFLPLLFLATATPVQAADPVSVQLQVPESVTLGDEITVTAVVKDSKGSPIPRAAVILWSPASFLGTGGALHLGRAVTDGQGRAAFRYEARSAGPVTLNASFAGDGKHEAAQASAEVAVKGSTQLYQETPPVQVPGVSGWALAGVVGGVWSIYLTVMVLLVLIAREGPKAPQGTGGRRG